MEIIRADDRGYVFIVCKEVTEDTYSHKEAIFIPQEVFSIVKTFVEVTKVEVDKDYWEDNRHDKIRNLLITMTGFSSRDISNSLAALGM